MTWWFHVLRWELNRSKICPSSYVCILINRATQSETWASSKALVSASQPLNPLNLSPKVPPICLCLSILTDLDNFLDQMTHQDIEMALITSRFKLHPTSMLQIVLLLKILQQYFQRATWQCLSKFKMGMPLDSFMILSYRNMREWKYESNSL